MRNRRSLSVAVESSNLALRAALSLGLVAAGVLVSEVASAQAARFPFPSSNTSALKSAVLTSHELRAAYADWKATFVEDCGGSMRVHYPENNGNDTRSEGVGYGMVIAAYMGDKTTFDGLLAFWQRFDNNNLMTWKINSCQGGADNGSASDADVDAAMGLILAERQWGGYAATAGMVLNGIRTAEVLACPNGRNLLDPGSDGNFGSCNCLNPSYFAPGYYGVFADFDTGGAATWNGMVGAAYGTLADAQNDTTGLVPAWSSSANANANGCNFQVAGGGNQGEYQSDAARVPWRVATDLAWTNSAAARTFLTPLNGWLQSANRITHIVDRYQITGSALPPFDPNGGAANNAALNNTTLSADGRRSTITMGAFAAGTVASNQDQLDHFVGAWQSLYTAGDSLGTGGTVQRHAFNSSLAILYGLLATGTMWNPSGADPAPVAQPTLNPADPANKLENGDFDEGLLGWKFVNIGPAGGAEGFAMHNQGELNILLQKAVDADNAYQVRLSQVVDVQAGKNYRIAFRAKGSAARPIKASVEFGGEPNVPYEGFGALGNLRDPEAPVTLSTDFQTYEWVFTSTGTRQNANFDIDVADSIATVTIDDVFFGETTLPPSVPGEGAPSDTPTTTPGQTPAAGGGTTPPAVGGPGGVTIPNQDLGSTPSGAPGAAPGGAISGAAPAPSGRLMGNGACTTNADCVGTSPADAGKYACSIELRLCFDTATGYVWDASAGAWSQPPRYFDRDGDGILDDDCGLNHVWWPKQRGCYDPASGYAYDEANMRWVDVGDHYTAGRDDTGGSDSGCSISQSPGAPRSVPLALAAVLLGAGVSFSYRRRSRAGR